MNHQSSTLTAHNTPRRGRFIAPTADLSARVVHTPRPVADKSAVAVREAVRGTETGETSASIDIDELTRTWLVDIRRGEGGVAAWEGPLWSPVVAHADPKQPDKWRYAGDHNLDDCFLSVWATTGDHKGPPRGHATALAPTHVAYIRATAGDHKGPPRHHATALAPTHVAYIDAAGLHVGGNCNYAG